MLIITYYWPPSGGSGVQRWLKFTKYLPQLGWEPIIYTPENPDFELKDTSLLNGLPENLNVIKTRIVEPYGIFRKFSKKASNTGVSSTSQSKKSLFSKMALWVRGNIFIPDPRIWWVKPSIKYLKSYLKNNRIDLIVSTGPPHSMHLIAQGLKRATGLPWVADFRDPFSHMDVYDDFYLSKRSMNKLNRLEQGILQDCNRLLATSYSLPEMLEDFDTSKMVTITNGYDEEDFEAIDKNNVISDGVINLLHVGTLGEVRNPTGLWEALIRLKNLEPSLHSKIKISFIGAVSDTIRMYTDNEPALKSIVDYKGYIGHSEIPGEYAKSDGLILAIHNSKIGRVCIPGKIYEYLASHKPIMAFGDTQSDSSLILSKTKTGKCFEYDDSESIYSELLKMLSSKKTYTPEILEIEKFSRLELTKDLVKLFEKEII